MFCIYLADRYWTGTDVRGGAAAAHMRGTVVTGTGTIFLLDRSWRMMTAARRRDALDAGVRDCKLII